MPSADAVKSNKADIGLGFDGDGDRCGVRRRSGREIFATRSACWWRAIYRRGIPMRNRVDVKSTGPLPHRSGAAAPRRQDDY